MKLPARLLWSRPAVHQRSKALTGGILKKRQGAQIVRPSAHTDTPVVAGLLLLQPGGRALISCPVEPGQLRFLAAGRNLDRPVGQQTAPPLFSGRRIWLGLASSKFGVRSSATLATGPKFQSAAGRLRAPDFPPLTSSAPRSVASPCSSDLGSASLLACAKCSR